MSEDGGRFRGSPYNCRAPEAPCTGTEAATERRKNLQPQVPIDLDFLAVQTWRDAGLQRDILRLFIEQARQAMHELGGDRDFESVIATLHAVKGSALALGAHQVAARAAEAESQLAQAPFPLRPEVEPALQRLVTALVEASAFAARLLEEHDGIGLAK